jgi:lysophospholipase L1-like esterase
VKKLLALASVLVTPAFALAANANYGTLWFFGDSITLGADGSNSGFRGDLIQDLNPVPTTDGVSNTPQPGQSIFTTVGTSSQMASNYLLSLGTPGYTNPYINHDGHPGATIQDLYNNPNNYSPSSSVSALLPQLATPPTRVYLMMGSNNAMTYGDTSDLNTDLQDELSIISYIKNNDPNLVQIFVEPPPSYPSQSIGDGPNGYDQYASMLGTALDQAPYSAYTTFVDSRPELTEADFSPDGDPPTTQYLHPNDAGYQIIANDLYAATINSVPEPGTLSILGMGAIGLLARRRGPTAS